VLSFFSPAAASQTKFSKAPAAGKQTKFSRAGKQTESFQAPAAPVRCMTAAHELQSRPQQGAVVKMANSCQIAHPAPALKQFK